MQQEIRALRGPFVGEIDQPLRSVPSSEILGRDQDIDRSDRDHVIEPHRATGSRRASSSESPGSTEGGSGLKRVATDCPRGTGRRPTV